MSKKELDKIVGAAYEDLNTEDMEQTQGAGDVDAEVVSNCFPTVSVSTVPATASIVSITIMRNN